MCFGIGRWRITPSTLSSSFIARSRVLHSSCDSVLGHVWSSNGIPTFFAALAWPRT